MPESWPLAIIFEALAVALAIAYLLLAIRQHSACWAAAIASAAIYIVLMYRASLYMESALQLFYIAVAVYGWRAWTAGGASGDGLPVITWPWRRHVAVIVLTLVMSAATAFLLGRYSAAALPFVDSLTTWGAIITTFMVARKVLENWFYWFVIDGLSVYLYVARELYLTAALFVAYLVLIVFGYRAWRRSYEAAGP